MKQFLNFFYILPFKVLLLVLIALTCFCCNKQVTDGAYLFKQDRYSVMNVLLQKDSFDYYSSTYLKNEIETAIRDVITYSTKYALSVNDTDKVKNYLGNADIFDKYTKYMNEEFRTIVTRLNSIENFAFAFVNHGTGKIVSNIPEINGESSHREIRSLFKGNEKNLLIVYSAKNPYFEKGTMTEYVSFVNELSEKHSDDFDLYISFNEELRFATSPEEFNSRHNNMMPHVYGNLNTLIFFLLITLVLIVLFMCLVGRQEYKGKYILATDDKIPNDLKLLMFCVIFFSMTALYEISLYMMIKPKQEYLFNISSDFYAHRSTVCFIIMVLMVLSVCTTVKRQCNHRIFLTNTYIYRFIKMIKEKTKS